MAEKKFFVDINLQGSALTNATIGTNSSLTKAGSFGFDGTRLKYFDGTAIKDVANLADISAVTGGLIFQGGYDPTTNTPDIADGTALKGFFWAATAAGTFLGESVQVGDSIVAKVDNAGATIADWLILQGNIVVATDSVDGISRLATQTEANDGTESGAVVITPATLQGKIDAQITPEINSKVSKSGDTMSGDLNMGNNNIENAKGIAGDSLSVNSAGIDVLGSKTPDEKISLNSDLDSNGTAKVTNLPAPTNGGDAANKTYVDNADALKLDLAGGTMSGTLNMGNNTIDDVNNIRINAAPIDGKDATNKSYVDEQDALKLSLTGGTMSGAIDMDGNNIANANSIVTNSIESYSAENISLNSTLDAQSSTTIINLPAPTNTGDAANKLYVDGAASTAQANAEATASADATAKADAAQAAAEAYADSLAPNYDAAGSAATAEANANSYTDTAIENNSYRTEINFADWTLNGSQYEFEITHNITGTPYPVVTFTDENEITVEAVYQAISGTAIKVIVNNRPPVLGVSLGAANAF